LKKDSVVAFRNAKANFYQSALRVVVDKWGNVTQEDYKIPTQ